MKVAKFPAMRKIGVWLRVSSAWKLGSGSGLDDTLNLAAKSAGMGTGGADPVIISYAPESEPVDGLFGWGIDCPLVRSKLGRVC